MYKIKYLIVVLALFFISSFFILFFATTITFNYKISQDSLIPQVSFENTVNKAAPFNESYTGTEMTFINNTDKYQLVRFTDSSELKISSSSIDQLGYEAQTLTIDPNESEFNQSFGYEPIVIYTDYSDHGDTPDGERHQDITRSLAPNSQMVVDLETAEVISEKSLMEGIHEK